MHNKLPETFRNAYEPWIYFWGGVARLFVQTIKELCTAPFYFRLLVEQLYLLGYKSFLLVSITGFITGAVMTLQFGLGLARFGGKFYVPKIVSLSIIRELGPVFISLLVAGRIGSGITAEIGSMNVTQQIDAIRSLGTSPIKRIVIPRVLACIIILPLLNVYSNVIAIIGASLVAYKELDIPIQYFMSKAFEGIQVYDLMTGCLKAFVFGLFISMTACWKGLHTEGGTQGVGNATTWVVVTSYIFIMVADFFLTKCFFFFIYNHH